MTTTNSKSEELFERAKSGEDFSDTELGEVFELFYGPFSEQTYESLLLFALVFPYGSKHFKRYQELFSYFRRHDTADVNLSDRAAAVITAVCTYWCRAELFESELRSTLEDWPWEDYPDTCIRAASSFAGLIYENQSTALFQYLKKIALERFETTDKLERDVLVQSLITAKIGFRKSPKKLAAQIHTKSELTRLSLE